MDGVKVPVISVVAQEKKNNNNMPMSKLQSVSQLFYPVVLF